MHSFLTVSSTVLGFIAAFLWFWSATIVVPTDLASAYGGTITGLDDTRVGLKKVAHFNQFAAAATALTVLFQVLAQCGL
jgi:hypothetical protein